MIIHHPEEDGEMPQFVINREIAPAWERVTVDREYPSRMQA